MSLSNQSTSVSPAKHYLRVKSGTVNYYDKELKDNIDVPVPLSFVVLDQLATVKGWSDNDQSGYWSNEVKSVGTDPVTVRTAKGIKVSGIWKDIKNEPAVSGAKFNASVYIAAQGRDGLEIQNIAFSGASLNAWIEFVNANKGVTRGKNKVVIAGFDDAKKGAVKYQTPRFEVAEITDEELAEATKLDEELQEYLGGYFADRRTDEIVEEVGVDLDNSDPIDLSEIPF
jgi:hypothetical protein